MSDKRAASVTASGNLSPLKDTDTLVVGAGAKTAGGVSLLTGGFPDDNQLFTIGVPGSPIADGATHDFQTTFASKHYPGGILQGLTWVAVGVTVTGYPGVNLGDSSFSQGDAGPLFKIPDTGPNGATRVFKMNRPEHRDGLGGDITAAMYAKVSATQPALGYGDGLKEVALDHIELFGLPPKALEISQLYTTISGADTILHIVVKNNSGVTLNLLPYLGLTKVFGGYRGSADWNASTPNNGKVISDNERNNFWISKNNGTSFTNFPNAGDRLSGLAAFATSGTDFVVAYVLYTQVAWEFDTATGLHTQINTTSFSGETNDSGDSIGWGGHPLDALADGTRAMLSWAGGGDPIINYSINGWTNNGNNSPLFDNGQPLLDDQIAFQVDDYGTPYFRRGYVRAVNANTIFAAYTCYVFEDGGSRNLQRFAKTTDQGVTWSEPLFAHGEFADCLSAAAWVNPAGTICNAMIIAGDQTGRPEPWLATTQLTSERTDLQAFSFNGRMYVLGGNNGSGAVTTVEKATINGDGTLGSWSSETALPHAVQGHRCFVDAANSRVYLIGGFSGTTYYNTVHWASINGGTGAISAWTATTPFVTARAHHEVWHNGNNAYVGGGEVQALGYGGLVGTFAIGETITGGTSGATAVITFDDGSNLNLDSVTGTFVAAETITGGTSGATANVGGLALYIGVTADMQVSLINTGTGNVGAWTGTQALPNARASFVAFAAGTNGSPFDNYLASFLFYEGGGSDESTVAKLDGSGGVTQWFPLGGGDPAGFVGRAAGCLSNGRMYLLGGTQRNSSIPGNTVNYTTYDVNGEPTHAGADWKTGRGFDIFRERLAATAWNGYIYAIGGSSRYSTLNYINRSSPWTGSVLTGGTSGATGNIESTDRHRLYLDSVVGTFQNGETVNDGNGNTATVSGTLIDPTLRSVQVSKVHISPYTIGDVHFNRSGNGGVTWDHAPGAWPKVLDVSQIDGTYFSDPVNCNSVSELFVWELNGENIITIRDNLYRQSVTRSLDNGVTWDVLQPLSPWADGGGQPGNNDPSLAARQQDANALFGALSGYGSVVTSAESFDFFVGTISTFGRGQFWGIAQ